MMATMPITIRPLTTLDDCRKVTELEKVVWGYTDAEDVVPSPVLIVSIKRGGVLLGAFDGSGEMKGFVYSMPAIKDGRPTQWSHMLGVTPDARSTGIGADLKLAQREAALAMGVDLVEWTYDPLQAANAHLNFAKLGVVVEEYEENIYGESSSPLHRGTPTDRFVAEWHLRAPHVERRIAAASQLLARDGSSRDAPLVNPSRESGEWLSPGPFARADDRRVLVEIPTGFSDMQLRSPQLAREWRMATREIFQTYLSRGYRVVDFFLNRSERRGHYLIADRALTAGRLRPPVLSERSVQRESKGGPLTADRDWGFGIRDCRRIKD
jgi:predicted GNAT superfamily acetyltransferase